VVPIPVLVNLIRFLRAFWRSLKDPEFQALFFLVLVTLASGTLYYRQVEVQLGWETPQAHLGLRRALVAKITTIRKKPEAEI
jgi:hypothetical protein